MSSTARKTFSVLLVLFGAVLLVICGFVVYHLPTFTERNTCPFCHKQIYMSLRIWTDDRKTATYPNINGSGHESLHAIVEEMNTTKHEAIYNYVPGLKTDDPIDLVLFYSKRRTRFIWHGDFPNIFREKRWILIPPNFYTGDSRPNRGELSDWVTTAELKARLQKTLDFLKAEQRTNWQQVVQEHTAFLERLSE